MNWCVANGIMDGKTKGTIAPRDTIIVAEAVAMIWRADSVYTGVVKIAGLYELKSALVEPITDAQQPQYSTSPRPESSTSWTLSTSTTPYYLNIPN